MSESHAQFNPPGPNDVNFAQGSQRSPTPATPVENAAGMTSGGVPTGNARPSVAGDRCYNLGVAAFAPESRPHPAFPRQISYDTRTVPSGTGPSRWYNAMLGRSNFVGGNGGIPNAQNSTGTFTLAPTAPVATTLRSRDADGHHPPMPASVHPPIDCTIPICRAACHAGAY